MLVSTTTGPASQGLTLRFRFHHLKIKLTRVCYGIDAKCQGKLMTLQLSRGAGGGGSGLCSHSDGEIILQNLIIWRWHFLIEQSCKQHIAQ